MALAALVGRCLCFGFYQFRAPTPASTFLRCYRHPSGARSLVTYPEILCNWDNSAFAVPASLAIVNLCVLGALLVLKGVLVYRLPTLTRLEHTRRATKFISDPFRPGFHSFAFFLM